MNNSIVEYIDYLLLHPILFVNYKLVYADVNEEFLRVNYWRKYFKRVFCPNQNNTAQTDVVISFTAPQKQMTTVGYEFIWKSKKFKLYCQTCKYFCC